MRKRGLCCRPVSVTLVHCIHTAEDIVKRFCRQDIVLVLDPQRRYPILRETHSAGGAKYKGWENFVIFALIAVYLGNCST